MSSSSTIRLLEVDPDLGRFLGHDEREAAEQVTVPLVSIPRGPLDLSRLLQDMGAFGALVERGLVLQRLRVSDQPALRLLGPGDILSLSSDPVSMLLADADWRVPTELRLALFGNDVLLAAHRWPRLVAGLHVRTAEQCERLAAQLAICQLSRVDQRLLALMWLLAESWGQVTTAGTLLPMAMTHDALGALIGARRPTVTLALGELSERGAIVRQDRGWLLLEAPPTPETPMPKLEEPRMLDEAASLWAVEPPDGGHVGIESYLKLRETIHRLREEHVRSREEMRMRVAELAEARERTTANRRMINEKELRRRAPSS
jgi:hypothetical protein